MTGDPLLRDAPLIRVGMVDDHRSPIWGIERVLDPVADIALICSAGTVAGVLGERVPLDVVLLDLRLDDGTTPRENVNALSAAGVATVVYTSGEHPALLRSAARAGALGVVLKSADEAIIIDAIRAAAQGRVVLTTEWAAAIDGDPELAAVDLSPQLQKVLALYASGETSARVGAALGVSAETVNEYLKRIRQKYADAGRPTRTKVDLFKRAVEDGWLPVPQRRAASTATLGDVMRRRR
ncbi:LuxR C-terminal-related transcriptional regulator [Gordonia sp. 'Campus']|uniref:LuxR C-terminal-related transcriptional regulator n=1 Tax=Gordonia sp. 'Campus' TaxID=2915824 RepID=UPI001EE3DB7C|nr:LuxR C-terminal-related transcriptional regulator [Gordonia sp. 'Campus']